MLRSSVNQATLWLANDDNDCNCMPSIVRGILTLPCSVVTGKTQANDNKSFIH